MDLLHHKSAHTEIHKLEALHDVTSAAEAVAAAGGSSAGTSGSVAATSTNKVDGNQSVLLKWCQPRATSGGKFAKFKT